MNFHTLALSLGGRPFTGHYNYYHIADLTVDQIRARAGAPVSVQRIGGHVLLQFPVTEGTAVILGALDARDATATGASEMLRDSDILLIDEEQQRLDRRSRHISPMPPPN